MTNALTQNRLPPQIQENGFALFNGKNATTDNSWYTLDISPQSYSIQEWGPMEDDKHDSLGFTNTGSEAVTGIPRYTGDVEQRSIGLQLNIPLYSGGLISSQRREAFHQLTQTEQQRESLRRQVVETTRNLYRAVNTDVEQVQARRQSIVSNQSALEATDIGYQVGTRNIVDVLDTQRRLFASVRDYNNARYDYIIDSLRLKQAAGTLNPGDLEDLQRYLKTDYDPDTDFLPPDLSENFARPVRIE